MMLEHKAALGQILFAGGAGFVGRTAVRWFRERHPSIRVLIGGRNLQAAAEIAQEVGAAEAVAIDIDKPKGLNTVGHTGIKAWGENNLYLNQAIASDKLTR
jgi:nucleoside-diphosphate-sugar epimerase